PSQYSHSASSAPNVSASNVPSLSSSSSSSSKRHVLKARRTARTPAYICVLDTNVLIENLNTIKSLIVKNRKKSAATANCDTGASSNGAANSQPQVLKVEIDHIVVPWVVFQELDGVKMSGSKNWKDA